MKISTITRYGLRAMVELARNGKEYVSLKEIARRENISIRYLENIMVRLVSAGLVLSSRGKNGGFKLVAPPEKINVFNIVNALEETLSLVFCVDNPHLCERKDSCSTYPLWKGLKKVIERFLKSFTLKDLVERNLKEVL